MAADQEGEGFPRCKAAKKKTRSRHSVSFPRLAAGEPFRLMFPLGFLAGTVGVALWPLFYGGVLGFHPGLVHARLMIVGFLGGLVFGFMGTALPRMLSAPRLTVAELAVVGTGNVLACALWAGGRLMAGDVVFLAVLLFFMAVMGYRWMFRRKNHPPFDFVLASLGLVCAVTGILILLASQGTTLSPGVFRMGSLLLYQGFPIFPILGIGGFLMPRFLYQTGSARRKQRPVFYVLVAVVLLASFVVETLGHPRWGNGIRFVIVLTHLHMTTDVLRRTRTPGTLAFALRAAVGTLLIGLATVVAMPEPRIGMEHIVFVGGYSILAMCIASRVVLGHSGRSDGFSDVLSRYDGWSGCRSVRWPRASSPTSCRDFWCRITFMRRCYGLSSRSFGSPGWVRICDGPTRKIEGEGMISCLFKKTRTSTKTRAWPLLWVYP